MKRTIFLLVIFLLSGLLQGQDKSGIIKGVVTDKVTEEKLPGVNVLILEKDNVGAATNNEGEYVISNLSTGSYKIRFSLVGYETLTVDAMVKQNTETILNVNINEQAVTVDEVIVTAQKDNHLNDIRPSTININPIDIKRLAGGGEDVLRSLRNLPGVTSVSDLSAQFTVRGSSPEQNLILIDGFEVLNPYRLYGFTSMYNPETVSEINLQTGGFSAEYGDRLSSVLSVRSRNGDNTKLLGGKINISLTNMNIILEGKLPLIKNASFILSARRTYYDMIVGPVLKSSKVYDGDVALPNFRDIQGKLVIPFNESHTLQLNVLSSSDGMSLLSSAERENIDSVSATDNSQNTLVGITYNFIPVKNLYIETQLSYYQNGGIGTMSMNMLDPTKYNESLNREDTLGINLMSWDSDYDYSYTKKSLSQKLLWKNENHFFEFGYGIDALSTDITNHILLNDNFLEYLNSKGESFPTNITERLNYNRYNIFLTDAVVLGTLTVKGGLRMDMYPVLKENIFLSPRFNLSYRIDEVSTLRAAYGKYYQSPGMEKQDMSNRITYSKESFNEIIPESADHFIIGYERMLDEKWRFNIEGYYKNLSNIIVPMKVNTQGATAEQIGVDPRSKESWIITDSRYDSLTNVPFNGAKGVAYGIELVLEKINISKDDKLSGWISYALSLAERERDGKKSPFLYDQRHAINIAGNFKFAERWDIGFKFSLRSGRPYAEAFGVQPRVITLSENGLSYKTVQVDEAGNTVLDVNYEKDNYSGKLNLYHSLDLRVTNYTTLFGLDWSFYLDIQNVYNRKNEEQASYYVDENGSLKQKYTYGLPIFPSLGLSVSF
ncbi:MAG: TonB-dependent receptor [Ignavibacterium sp.]|nr:TonB-dependent receptor [Ignavibacterium sp.]